MIKNPLRSRKKKPKKIVNVVSGGASITYPSSITVSTTSSGITDISVAEQLFRDFKYSMEHISDDEKVELLKMLNDEYKVILRKEKLKNIE